MAFEVLFLIGRIIVGIYFIMNAYNHFKNKKAMIEYAKMKQVQMPELAVPFTGLLLLLGGLSILCGYQTNIGITFIALFLIPVSFMMHNFWAVPEQQKMIEKVNFMKNMALLGFNLMLLLIPTPWPFSFF